jgi:protein-S-isoprenylcysteine O-methyltransferase Ste14
MEIGRIDKLFGVGPKGALISLALFVASAWIDRLARHPPIIPSASILKDAGATLIILGLGLHFWALSTLRNWWKRDRLCTGGPFKWFRHPMYAAWITFVALGLVLVLNSWILLAWAAVLHPIWHRLVRKEEAMMVDRFGDDYRRYASRTGRFIPRVPHR